MKYRMKYRLKDRELQKKLDDLTDGDFSKRLSAEGERMEIMTNCGRHCLHLCLASRRTRIVAMVDCRRS